MLDWLSGRGGRLVLHVGLADCGDTEREKDYGDK